jgi:hypothetical protein
MSRLRRTLILYTVAVLTSGAAMAIAAAAHWTATLAFAAMFAAAIPVGVATTAWAERRPRR